MVLTLNGALLLTKGVEYISAFACSTLMCKFIIHISTVYNCSRQ